MMGYQSEAQLEQKLIEQLRTQGYDYVSIPNEVALEANLKEQMNIHNETRLKGKPLSTAEFDRFLLEVKGHSVFESAKILRDKVIIERDDGSTLYIEPFDTVNWKRITSKLRTKRLWKGNMRIDTT